MDRIVQREEFSSGNPEEAQAWLRDAYGRLTMRLAESNEAFHFKSSGVAFGGMHFDTLTHSMAAEAMVPDGLRRPVVVSHVGGGPYRLWVDGQEIEVVAGESYLIAPGRPYQAAWSGLTVAATMLSYEDLVSDAVGLEDEATSLALDCTRPLSAAAGRQWAQTTQYVQTFIATAPVLAGALLAQRELSRMVNSALLACFPNLTLDGYAWSGQVEDPRPLRRALAFIEEHAGQAINVREIATAARLSPRGLQAAFRRHLDTTPLAHLRSVRFDRAHRELLECEADTDSVSAVALRWGFTHLGRFAADYKRRFGLYPSQTLRR